MEFELRPALSPQGPPVGFLLTGETVLGWLQTLDSLGIALHQVAVHPLPGRAANTVWGCLVVAPALALDQHWRYTRCYVLENRLFMPEHAVLWPPVSPQEFRAHFRVPSLFHPEIGLVELPDKLDWSALLSPPPTDIPFSTAPESGVTSPLVVKSFQVQELPPENVLAELEEALFPNQKRYSDQPLNALEKVKLFFLRLLMGTAANTPTPTDGWWNRLRRQLQQLGKKLLGKKGEAALDRLKSNLDELEARNQKEADKLIDLFQKDLDQALKLAIPLEDKPPARGNTQPGAWRLGQTGGSGAGGTVYMSESKFNELARQYRTTAAQLQQNGEYEKAAYVYLKLLKDYSQGAKSLQYAGKYQEAASIYLDQLDDKSAAAECYETGHYTDRAIALYQEMERHEKAGDLLLSINKYPEAMEHYQLEVDRHESRKNFMEAGLISYHKMNAHERGQNLLMKSWEARVKPVQSMRHYLHHQEDYEARAQTLQTLHQRGLAPSHQRHFMEVLKEEYRENTEQQETLREVAYEQIAQQAQENPEWVSEVVHFHKDDDTLKKDTLRYKQKRRRKK